MKLYKRVKNLVFEAGWYPGENWTALDMSVAKVMPEIGYVVILYLQIGKAAISVSWDSGKV